MATANAPTVLAAAMALKVLAVLTRMEKLTMATVLMAKKMLMAVIPLQAMMVLPDLRVRTALPSFLMVLAAWLPMRGGSDGGKKQRHEPNTFSLSRLRWPWRRLTLRRCSRRRWR